MEESSGEGILTLYFSVSTLFRTAGMLMERLHGDDVEPLDMAGEVTERT